MRILIAGIIALILLIGGYFLWWNQVADRLVDTIKGWEQQRIAEGYEISRSPLVISDFPYRVRVTTDNLVITGPEAEGKPVLRMKELWAVVEPWNLTHAIFGLLGGADASWMEKGERRSLRLDAETAHASATFDLKGHVETTAIDLQHVELTPSWRAHVTADRLQLHSRPAPGSLRKGPNGKELPPSDPALQIAMRGDKVTVEDMQDFPLGQTMEKLGLSAILHGRLPLPLTWENAGQWRDTGGYVQILDLVADWGTSAIEGEGEVAIDDQFYPIGKMRTKIMGYRPIVAALLKTRRISEKAARMLGFALPLLEQKKDDGTKYIAAPVAAVDQGLYLGPVFLMPLAPLDSQ
ncbi:MAG: DUF2125 domain-containing protein [Alphaproteobacteria bacterium]|nr:MAG: DUF2125 domain-containing protein [Alphaproteobacteria bacterium]